MKVSKTTIAAISILFLLTFLYGCNRAQTVNREYAPEGQVKSTADSPYIKVYVTKAGAITLNGNAATLDEAGKAFAALAQEKGVVLYSREAPSEFEPHPNATKVIDLAIKNRLPIRLCMDKNCLDALDENGKLLVGN
jgi:hypothetical protein